MTQIIRERLFLREPNTDRLRKSAAGHLRHLLATGWRETNRSYGSEYVIVDFERPGEAPREYRAPAPAPRPPRRDDRPQFRGRR